jgi:DivIVA domain-containing protein
MARGQLSAGERDRMVSEARDVRFSIVMRGYSRADVDRYVKEVNRLIAELEISSSPESAVRHALEEVSEETRDILQRAHQTAEEITARSRAKADDRLAQAEQQVREIHETAEREAKQMREEIAHEVATLRDAAKREVSELKETTLRETRRLRAASERDAEELLINTRREADETLDEAESRVRELTHSADAIWRERRRVIEDITALGSQLLAIGEAEGGKRYPRGGYDATFSERRGSASGPQEPPEAAGEQHGTEPSPSE